MNGRIDTVLSVENIKVKAKHGWYEEERQMGGVYIINVHFASTSDVKQEYNHLSATINYELIHAKVISIMKQEHKLIEHCCKAIFDEMKLLSKNGVWTIELIKQDPPLKFIGQTKYKISG